jgi:hypothetical protein
MIGAGELPALYEGHVVHARRSPLQHRFRYRACYWLVDVDRLPAPGGVLGLLTQVRGNDHVDVRQLLAERGLDADRVVMLTTARTFGYVFNPITVFWSADAGGRPTAVVVEVHNTYGDRHAYVLDAADLAGTEGEGQVAKAMPVSPFNPAGGHYRIRAGQPGASVAVTVVLERDGSEPLVATLRADRRPMTAGGVIRSALRFPGLRTMALIRWQGLRLWGRGLPVQPR